MSRRPLFMPILTGAPPTYRPVILGVHILCGTVISLGLNHVTPLVPPNQRFPSLSRNDAPFENSLP